MSAPGPFWRAAERYARAGFAPVPVKPGDKAPPLAEGWPRLATTDVDRMRELWRYVVPDANIAVVTGPVSDWLIVIDIDRRHGGPDTFAALIAEHGPLTTSDEWPFGWTVDAPDGSHHWVSAPWLAIRNSEGKRELGPGVDVRGEGGYVMVPPSRRPEGVYRWRSAPRRTTRGEEQGIPGPRLTAASLPRLAPEWEPLLVTPMPDPDELEAGLRNAERVERAEGGTAYGRAAAESAFDRISRAEIGTRNATLNAEAFGLGQLVGSGHLALRATLALLVAAGRAAGLPEREASRTAQSGLRAGVLQPRGPRKAAA